MTIASDILAQVPLVYWKLDDPTGPAASDASGNAHPGAYGGGFSLGVPGVEVGTIACQLAAGGSIAVTTPLSGNVDQSMLLYLSMIPTVVLPNLTIAANGDPTAALRGLSITRAVVATGQMAVNYRPSGSQALGAVNADPKFFWHCWGLTYVAASRTMTAYVDGVAGTPVVASAVLTTTAGDTLQVAAAFGCVVAHFALFNRVLTAPQMLGIAGHTSQWPYGLMIPYPHNNAPFATTTDINVLSTNDAAILAAVRRTY